MIKNISIVRNCKNCVKPRKSRPVGHFVRSNYVSSNADRVKGHHAKRLFAFNSKRINREFDIKHHVGKDNTDEALIAQALKSRKELESVVSGSSLTDKAVESNWDEETFRYQSDKQRQQIHLKDQEAQHAAKEATTRQKRRNDFLKDIKNKVCHICGARGHVAKQCNSEKKKKNISKRTVSYKKHLIKKNKFKLDLDAEYKKMQDRIKTLEAEVAALRSHDNGDASASIASKEINMGKVSQAPAQETVIISKPAVSKIDGLVSECSSSSNKQATYCCNSYEDYLQRNYEETKAYFRTHKPKETEPSRPEEAQAVVLDKNCVKIGGLVLIASLVVLLLIPVLTCLINNGKRLYLFTSTACVEFVHNIRWTSFIVYPSTSVLIYILCGASIIILIWRRIYYKVDRMMEWAALSDYREKLKSEGVTQRLPYKVFQIGSTEFSYTSRTAYQESRKQTFAALTPISVLVCFARAIYFVLQDMRRFCIYVYKNLYRRYLVNKVVKPVFKIFRYLTTSLVIIVSLLCFKTMVFALRHYLITATVCLAITLYYGHMEYQAMYAICINWVCQTTETVLAKFSSMFDMMAYSIHPHTWLTTTMSILCKMFPNLNGLLSGIMDMLKHN